MTAIVQTQRYAGFWIRVGAYLIDAIALSVVGSLLGSNAHYGPDGYDQFSRSRDLSGLLNLVYFVAFWTYNGGQTVGNRLLGLRVVKSTARRSRSGLRSCDGSVSSSRSSWSCSA